MDVACGASSRDGKVLRYQHVIVYNRVLPCADKIEEHSRVLLREIQINLGKAVSLREIRPGASLWSHRLSRYIRVFGLKFCKQDHVNLVYLMYELVVIPDLEPQLLSRFAQTLTLLLKKKHLLKPEDLTIPWEPLYNICSKLLFSTQGSSGLYRFFTSLQGTLEALFHVIKVYFPLSATKEIMERLRPIMCPFDPNCMLKAITSMEWFLPITIPPEFHHFGYEMWFKEQMEFWISCNNDCPWEQEFFWLMGRLARHNTGYIDWEPYIPFMFTKFIRSLGLPVSYKSQDQVRSINLDTTPVALWIVSILGGGGSAQHYLERLITSLECYYYPPFNGKWYLKLADFLRELPSFFVLRVHSERHKKPSWESQVKEGHKLTDDDITKFVQTLKPIALFSAYSKMLSEGNDALRYLATLRPDLIIPDIVERYYLYEHSYNEPSRLAATLQCMSAVSRPMLESKWNGYPEGQCNVIPILIAVIPCIDPNDLKKCFAAFLLISSIVSMTPIIDVSEAHLYHKDLTAEEEELCRATAHFQDFVMQFLDQCLNLIESSALENTRLEREENKRSRLENMLERGLTNVCITVFSQTSPEIFQKALRKLTSYVRSHILETQVAAQYLGVMCRAFVKAYPEEALRALLPYLYSVIIQSTSLGEMTADEGMEKELLYHLLIFSEIVETHAVVPYLPLVIEVLDLTLHLSNREAYKLASKILSYLLHGLCTTVPLEYRSSRIPFDINIKDYCHVKDWGKYGNIDEMNITWYVPGKQELDHVQAIVSNYLPAELERLNAYIEDGRAMTREEIQTSLGIITSILSCKDRLPIWEELPLRLGESFVDNSSFIMFNEHDTVITMPDGGNVRSAILLMLDRLQKKLLIEAEDDTRSLFCIINLWEDVMDTTRCISVVGDLHWRRFQSLKDYLKNRLCGGKKHMRGIMIHRSKFQHDFLLQKSIVHLTESHRKIIMNLFDLATSHYSEVRCKAQSTLQATLDTYINSYRILVPVLVESLGKDSNKYHEQFKGALHVLLGRPLTTSLLTVPDWKTLSSLWPAIVLAKPSEKPSVIKLIEEMENHVHRQFTTVNINVEVPESCRAAAVNVCGVTVLSDDFEIIGLEMEERRNRKNLRFYHALLNALMDAIEDNLHWRLNSLATMFLRVLIHANVKYPARIVKYFMHGTINDAIGIRKTSAGCVVYILKQQKQIHKTIVVDPYMISGNHTKDDDSKISPGCRPDNAWVQYNSKSRPMTAAEWDEPRYLHKPYSGYYMWPKEQHMYAPSYEQPSVNRDSSMLSDEEKEVDTFFSDEENVAKLIKYFSLEEKGLVKFNVFRFLFFKGLFRNHGDAFLEAFKPHLKELISSKIDSSQRCAAEILAGLIRGSKHWPFDKVQLMWNFLIPLLKEALTNMTVDTVSDWGVCFATALEGRDPNRLHWLLELLMDNPLRDETSFTNCGRLYALQGGLNQLHWRVAELYHRLLEYIQPFLSHSYQNVRDRLGSLMSNIFDADIRYTSGNPTISPHLSEFVATLLPQLSILTETKIQDQNAASGSSSSMSSCPSDSPSKGEQQELSQIMSKMSLDETPDQHVKSKAVKLLKTVCKWICASAGRAPTGTAPDFFKFLPLICMMESSEGDEEMSEYCIGVLRHLCSSKVTKDHIPFVIAALKEVAENPSWTARVAMLEFLQVFVFCNGLIIQLKKEWNVEVIELVVNRLSDEWLDVRMKASETLSGFFYTNFITDPLSLVEIFKSKANTHIVRKETQDRARAASITARHSGILGLCAYVTGYPCSIPEPMSEIINILSGHTGDPPPIPSTIIRAVHKFRKSHYINIPEFRVFIEEHLSLLADIDVPPAHYA